MPYLVSLVGIQQVVLAINKMDLVGFDERVFNQIRDNFAEFARTVGIEQVAAIPLSALKGDNVTQPSAQTPWYDGPTLMGCLETAPVHGRATEIRFPRTVGQSAACRFPWFQRQVAAGSVRPGDASGDLFRAGGHGRRARDRRRELAVAHAGDAITLTLDREIDASRGDVFSRAEQPLGR